MSDQQPRGSPTGPEGKRRGGAFLRLSGSIAHTDGKLLADGVLITLRFLLINNLRQLGERERERKREREREKAHMHHKMDSISSSPKQSAGSQCGTVLSGRWQGRALAPSPAQNRWVEEKHAHLTDGQIKRERVEGPR